jgi:hypothetical protein
VNEANALAKNLTNVALPSPIIKASSTISSASPTTATADLAAAIALNDQTKKDTAASLGRNDTFFIVISIY